MPKKKEEETPGEGDKQDGIKYHPTSHERHLSKEGWVGVRGIWGVEWEGGGES